MLNVWMMKRFHGFWTDALTKKLLGVKGVGNVARVGGVNRQIWVELDTAKLQSLNATAADISRNLGRIQLEVRVAPPS